MDGGASSGLWTREGYLREPGRDISNALLVVERPAVPKVAGGPALPDWPEGVATPERRTIQVAAPAPVRPPTLPLVVVVGLVLAVVGLARRSRAGPDL